MGDDDGGGGVVRAGGGIVWRPTAGPGIEILVVHRPRYDDWSLPKGKVDPGEAWAACATREVEEETGFTPVLGPEVARVDYTDHRGRPKVVRYWEMTVAGGSFRANDEVDEVAWLAPDAAAARLTYPHDRRLVHLVPHPG